MTMTTKTPEIPWELIWVYISDNTGMPIAVEKCSFVPSVHVAHGTPGRWHNIGQVLKEAGPREVSDNELVNLSIDLTHEKFGSNYLESEKAQSYESGVRAGFLEAMRLNAISKIDWPSEDVVREKVEYLYNYSPQGTSYMACYKWLSERVMGKKE
jgi:hypothetical protein